MLSNAVKSTYDAILKSELQLAMGCTEPIAIAYAAAILGDALGRIPEKISAGFSGNIIKNVKSVIVPATGGRHGIEAAIAAGLVSARPDKRLEVLTVLTEADEGKIDLVLAECKIEISKLSGSCTFELELVGEAMGDSATVKISGAHTNVTLVTKNGDDLTANYASPAPITKEGEALDMSLLSVESIIEYANKADLEEVKPYLNEALSVAIKMRDAEAQKRGNDIINNAVDYINEHYADEDISLDSVAEEINISANYLSALFSNKVGLSFVEYITKKRMAKAKILLRNTSKRSGEIANEIGYRDPRYFSFVFKKNQGCTPSQYRNGEVAE